MDIGDMECSLDGLSIESHDVLTYEMIFYSKL